MTGHSDPTFPSGDETVPDAPTTEDTSAPTALAGADGRPRMRVGAAFVACSVALLVAVASPVRLTVDGRSVTAGRGSTPAQLAAQGLIDARAGDLLSVKGEVLERGGGDAAVFLLDGIAVGPTTPLRAGGTLDARTGPDRTEESVSATVPVDPPIRYVGTGVKESIESSGVPGVARVIRGARSGIETSRVVVSTGTAMVVRREPAWRGPKEIALTFDDGPWPGQTDRILDILKSEGAKATFFLLGVKAQANWTLSRRIVAEGHEAGAHSMTHKMLARADRPTTTYEIAGSLKVTERATGVRPVWYRPAGGSVSSFAFTETKRLGLRLILWNIDTKDFRKPNYRAIADQVLGQARPGMVVLMHDGGGNRAQTIAALPLIIRGLKARGYKLVTLSELYRINGAAPAP